MTNYYAELNLDQNASPEELMQELASLEMLWYQREMTQPDLATEKLYLISMAKKVFSSASAKEEYDKELFGEAEEEPVDQNADRRTQFQKWYEEARNYWGREQYDLAKTAAEKALSFMAGEDEEDPYFYSLLASIYRNNEDVNTAMSYINKAIVLNPDEPEFYLEKAFSFGKMYLEETQNQYTNWDNARKYVRAQRNLLLQAAELGEKAGNKDVMGRAWGHLAFSYYYYDPSDSGKAEMYAKKAMEAGDRWENAKNVLDDINRRNKEAEDAAERRRWEQQQAEERARKAKLEEEERKRRAAQKKAFVIVMKILSALLYVLVIIYPAQQDIGMSSPFTALSFNSYAAISILSAFLVTVFLFDGDTEAFFYYFRICLGFGYLFSVYFMQREMNLPFIDALKAVGILAALRQVAFVAGLLFQKKEYYS